MKKFAVVLAGNGVFDGAEIHEATLTLLAINQQGGEYDIFAPNIPQHHVVNHINGEEMPEQRNVLVESARIARGKISDLKEFNPDVYDAIIFPGGFGVAKNLSTVAFDGSDAKVNRDVEVAVKGMLERGKPIGALCIAPAMIAKIIGDVKVTIGQDKGTMDAIKAMGGTHVETTHGEVVVDEKHKVFTTPCYMLDANISQIADGASNVVREMMKKIER